MSSNDTTLIHLIDTVRNNGCPGSKMTIFGRPEIGLEDVPWTLAAHRIDVHRSQNGPNSDRNFQNLIEEADIYKKY